MRIPVILMCLAMGLFTFSIFANMAGLIQRSGGSDSTANIVGFSGIAVGIIVTSILILFTRRFVP
jgi:hypothetical protein